MLEDFITVAEMPKEVIEKYRKRVPEILLEIWEKKGIGMFFDGYLQIINPDNYIDFVKETYFDGDVAIPIMLTAFGDVITWENNKHLALLEYKIEDVDIILGGAKHFWSLYKDPDFQKDYFDLSLYKKAVKKFGPLDYGECFGFVPILPLGGKKDVNHMDKVKIREHLYLLVQFTGGIFD